MHEPMPRHATIVAVTSEDDAPAGVRKRAREVAQSAASSVILWAADAAVSPLESPLPTDWSGEGEKEQFGDRLDPKDLIVAGHQGLAGQVDELREAGIDAWGWLPARADATTLATYATDHGATLILVPASDTELIEDLRAADEHGADGHGGGLRGVRVEAVPA